MDDLNTTNNLSEGSVMPENNGALDGQTGPSPIMHTINISIIQADLLGRLIKSLMFMQQSKEAGDNPEDFGVSPIAALSIYEKEVEEAATTLKMLLNQGERDALLYVLNKMKDKEQEAKKREDLLLEVF